MVVCVTGILVFCFAHCCVSVRVCFHPIYSGRHSGLHLSVYFGRISRGSHSSAVCQGGEAAAAVATAVSHFCPCLFLVACLRLPTKQNEDLILKAYIRLSCALDGLGWRPIASALGDHPLHTLKNPSTMPSRGGRGSPTNYYCGYV